MTYSCRVHEIWAKIVNQSPLKIALWNRQSWHEIPSVIYFVYYHSRTSMTSFNWRKRCWEGLYYIWCFPACIVQVSITFSGLSFDLIFFIWFLNAWRKKCYFLMTFTSVVPDVIYIRTYYATYQQPFFSDAMFRFPGKAFPFSTRWASWTT